MNELSSRPGQRPRCPAGQGGGGLFSALVFSVLVFALFVAAVGQPASVPSEENSSASDSARRSGAQKDAVERLATWVALNAPVGHEEWAIEALVAELDGWRRDRSGNLLRTLGAGEPHRVIACGLDAPAYAVTEITAQGYLRVHRLGRGSSDALWDQAHYGQQVRILGADGPRLGITAVPNNHFSNLHRHETEVLTADELWVDVGVESAGAVQELGIRLLDPVLRELPPWSFGELVAGPSAGSRIGCAAVVAAAHSVSETSGTNTFVLSTQQGFRWVGLAGALRNLGAVDEIVLLLRGDAEAPEGARDPRRALGALVPLLEHLGDPSVVQLAPRVAAGGALMERMRLADAEDLFRRLVARLGSETAEPAWIAAPRNRPLVEASSSSPSGSADELVGRLVPLAEAMGVSGHEGRIRELVRGELPRWARDRLQQDDLGNLWVEFGGDDARSANAAGSSEITVFMAHLDEVGFVIESIDSDGIVHLEQRGGAVLPAWEGQPAVLTLDPGSGADSASDPSTLRGVFLHREQPQQRDPESLRAWFGMHGADLEAAGVRRGMPVSHFKAARRIGSHRFTSRALDDRVGTAALVEVLRRIDPDQVRHPVVFAWSVQEETGLHGASELARRFGPRTRRIYSVDTFVSSDTPLESSHFAFAPLGAGPVLRSAENTSMATRREIERSRAIARRAGIEPQIGLTQGGTDGTSFTYFGVPNAGLSWPGRYSHSPVEIADLRDVEELVELIRALTLASGED